MNSYHVDLFTTVNMNEKKTQLLGLKDNKLHLHDSELSMRH